MDNNFNDLRGHNIKKKCAQQCDNIPCYLLAVCFFSMHIKYLSTIIESRSIMHHSFTDGLHLLICSPDKIYKVLHPMQLGNCERV